jgi:PAS domain-containing protein
VKIQLFGLKGFCVSTEGITMRNIDYIMEESEIGFARHKIIYDENGKASDYVFINLNTAFEKLTGLKKADILNRSVKKVIPTIIEDEFDWIDYYGKIVENEKKKVFEQYAPAMDKWYRVEAFSHQKGYFTTLFTDITHERELAEASKEFLNDEAEHNTYERITQRMKKICGADYVTLNIFSQYE